MVPLSQPPLKAWPQTPALTQRLIAHLDTSPTISVTHTAHNFCLFWYRFVPLPDYSLRLVASGSHRLLLTFLGAFPLWSPASEKRRKHVNWKTECGNRCICLSPKWLAMKRVFSCLWDSPMFKKIYLTSTEEIALILYIHPERTKAWDNNAVNFHHTLLFSR